MKGIPFVLAVAFALAAFAESEDFTIYESIIDRQMFGRPPADFDPTKKPSEVKAVTATAQKQADQELARQQQKVKSAIRFSMINVTPAGDTMVAFSDSSNPKEPKSYYLKVGESCKDGWTVKSADPNTEKMVIAKDDLEVEISLGGDSSKGGGQTTSRSAGPASGALAGGRPQPARSNTLSGRRESKFRHQQEEIAALKERFAANEAEQKKQQAARDAERAAEREAEKAAREEERERSRQNLEAMRQALKRAQESREKAEAEAKAEESADGESPDAE